MRTCLNSLLVLLVSTTALGQEKISISPVGLGWAGNSINTVIFRRNSITSHDGVQYLAYYDQEGHVILAKRKLDEGKWEIHQTQYSGDVRDAHNTIAIAVDGKGFLHVAWDHHNVPLRYACSVAAGSLELTDKLPMTGLHENRVTYPEFYNLPDGGLLFFYRDGESGNGNLLLDRYDVQTGTWQQVHENLIDGQNQRNAYWQAAVDEKGTIHLSWVWRESADVATNHDICYAKSSDGGKTWQKSTGENLALPINLDTAEIAVKIPQRHELINQTSMTTDSKGRPYIASYWRDEGSDVPQYHIVYHDGSGWKVSQAGQLTTPFRLGGTGTKRIPISRPQIFTDTSGTTDKAYLLYRDEARGNKISIAICDDLSKPTWRIEDLTDFSVGQWEPSFDIALWQSRKLLDVFVQQVEQRDGEGVASVAPQMVQVLRWQP